MLEVRFVLCTDLRMSTQTATREYASRVPIDMRSTRAASSKRKAMSAAGERRGEERTGLALTLCTFLCCLSVKSLVLKITK